MPSESYYLIVAIAAVLGLVWRVFSYIQREIEKIYLTRAAALEAISGKIELWKGATNREISRLYETRNAALEQINARIESRHSENSRRCTELSERMTTNRLAQMKEDRDFVTRGEIDKRFEKMEIALAGQNEKLEEILRHVAPLPTRG